MVVRRAIIFIFLSVNSLGCTQEIKQSINYRLNATRFDFFTGVEYTRMNKAFQPYAALEFGINRTVFQQRFFPKISIGMTYDLIKNERVLLGPTVHTSYSLLKVNRTTNHFHHWNELMAGIRFEKGKKWKYIFISEYGLIGETYFNQNIQDRELINTHGFLISMGFGYAW